MKFIQLLKAVRPEEYRDFEKFLQSPYFKSSEQYLKFFKFLCKNYPDFELEKNGPKQAYIGCFGAGAYSDGKLYNLLSGMAKQLEQFLVVQTVLNQDLKETSIFDQLLVKTLGTRNMGGYFRTEADALIREIEAFKVKEADHFHALYEINQRVYFNADTPKLAAHQPQLEEAALQLNLYYCMASLRIAAEMKAREYMFNAPYETPVLDAVLDYCTSSGFLQTHPVMDLYYRFVSLFTRTVDENGFLEISTAFKAGYKQLPAAYQPLMLRHLINCGLPLLLRDSQIEAELLSLYKFSIKENMLLDGSRLTHIAFINIVHLGSVCKEYTWVRHFMDTHGDYLEEDKKQIAIDLAEACLSYEKGNYADALKQLTPEAFYVPGYEIFSKMLMTKINFDHYILSGEQYEFLQTQLNAFEKFVINRQPVTPEKKTAQLNCIRFIRKMSTIKFEQVKLTDMERGALNARLAKLTPIASKSWLKKRIELL